jgi:methyl-accepting chemotaxis protein
MKKLKFYNKLSVKFIAIIYFTILILLTFTLIINYVNEKKLSLNEYEQVAHTTVNGVSKDITKFFFETIGYLQTIAKANSIREALIDPENEIARENANEILHEAIKYSPSMFNIALILLNTDKSYNIGGVTIKNGSFMISAREGSDSLIGMSALDEDWVPYIVDGKSYYIGQSFKDKITGIPLISISVPVHDNSKIIGAVELVLELSYFSENYSKAFAKNKDEYFYIVNNRKLFISHILKEAILNEKFSKESDSIVTSTVNGVKHFVYTFRGVKKHYFQTEPISIKNMAEKWYIGYAIPEKTILATAHRALINSILLFIALFIVLGFCISFFFNSFILKPINLISHSLEKIFSDNINLTDTLNIRKKDEFGQLASYYNKFIKTLAEVINSVKTLVNTVSSSSTEVATSMEETSRTVEEQTGQLAEIASSVEEITASGNAAREIVESAKNKTVEARNKTYRGSEIINNVISLINKVGDNSSSLAETIHRLTASTTKISSIVDVINEIADQTNLLALNAAIEAARAGEMGRGFAVVAEEVRKLAERTTSSTKEILDIITGVGREVEYVDKQMNETENSVNESKQSASEANKIFKEIVSIVEEVYESSNQIEETVTEQINALAKTNDNVQVISSASEETSRAVIEVTNTIISLQTELETLRAQMKKFKTQE